MRKALIHKDSSAVVPRGSAAYQPPVDAFAALHLQFGELWTRLWLFPDLPNLVRSLLTSFERLQWDWNAAYLLCTILEIQTVYIEFLKTTATPGQSSPFEPNVLLSLDDVVRIVDVFSSDLIRYHTDNFDSALNRELQFKVLSIALDLAKSLGANSFTHEYYQNLRNELKARQNDILNGRDANPSSIYSFGDGETLLRHAFDSLAETPSDLKTGVTLIRGFVNVVFAAGLVYTCNAPEALRCLQVFQELPDKPCKWHRSLQELGSWTLGAISLVRYSRVLLQNQERERMYKLGCNTARELVRKIDRVLDNQFQRLLQNSGPNNALSKFRQQMRHATIEVPPDAFHGILGLLYLIELLATEYGSLECFDGPQTFCLNAVRLSLEKPSFKLLRLKMLELLLSIKYARTGESRLSGHDLPPKVKHDNRAQLRKEADESAERFVRKKHLQDIARQYSVQQIDKFRSQMLPALLDYGLYRPPPPTGLRSETHTEESRHREYKPRNLIQNVTAAIGPGLPFRRPQRVETEHVEAHDDRAPVRAARGRERSRTTSIEAVPSPSPIQIRRKYTTATVETASDRSASISPVIAIHSSPAPPEQRQFGSFASSTALTDEMLRTLTSARSPVDGIIYESPVSDHFDVGNASGRRSPDLSVFVDQTRTHQGLSSPSSMYSQSQIPDLSSSRSVSPTNNGFLSPVDRSPRQKQPSRGSSSTGSTEWTEEHSGLRISHVEEQHVERVKLSKGKALKVQFSPNGQYAAFVYEKVVVLTKLSSINSRSTTMMKADKGEGFKTASLSDSHLTVLSNKNVKICAYDSGMTAPDSGTIMTSPIAKTVIPQCLGISQDSSLVAVGERLVIESSEGRQIVGAVQLYGSDLLRGPKLTCKNDEAAELPKSIAFSSDRSTIICNTTMNCFYWKYSNGRWHNASIEAVKVSGSNAKGITSAIPFNPWVASDDPELFARPPRQYVLLTSIPSNIRSQQTTFISSLADRSPIKSYLASNDQFHRSAISDDSLVAAFLTDDGKIKIATIIPGNQSRGLTLSEVPRVPSSASVQKEQHPEDAGQLHINVIENGLRYVVTAIDRHGKLIQVICRAERAIHESNTSAQGATVVSELDATNGRFNRSNSSTFELPHSNSFPQHPRELSATPSSLSLRPWNR